VRGDLGPGARRAPGARLPPALFPPGEGPQSALPVAAPGRPRARRSSGCPAMDRSLACHRGAAALAARLGPPPAYRRGRLCEGACAAVPARLAGPRAHYPSCGPRQRASGRPRGRPGHLPLARRPTGPPPPHDDARRRKVPPALPAPHAAAWVPTHQAFRLSGAPGAPDPARAMTDTVEAAGRCPSPEAITQGVGPAKGDVRPGHTLGRDLLRP
jgi:hypothetical protein